MKVLLYLFWALFTTIYYCAFMRHKREIFRSVAMPIPAVMIIIILICPMAVLRAQNSSSSVNASRYRFSNQNLSTSLTEAALHQAITDTSPLSAKILVPATGDLVRSFVHIYGIAGGKDFKEYRVEYGKGTKPDSWHLIESSQSPCLSFSPKQASELLKGNINLRGTLATWNTGLKNWEHLPWHPASDKTDFNGIYTIRLIVKDRNNRSVEDRVTVEVGRAIAQCLPGIACNDNQDIVLHFDEQSLSSSFRLYSIVESPQSAAANISPLHYASKVYRIREAGDKFIKPVSLSIKASDALLQKIPSIDRDKLYIAYYFGGKWLRLPSYFDNIEKSYCTQITELPPGEAIYALVCDPSASVTLEKPIAKPAIISPSISEILCLDDFSSGMSEWSPAMHDFGAGLEIVPNGRHQGNPALKITNRALRGNFECSIRSTSFDLYHYNKLSFWYRIPPEVQIDMMFLVEGRWYALGLNSLQQDSRYKDVNITNLGQFPGLKTDNTWRFAELNLCEIFSRCTGSKIVEKVMLASWKINGYMNLDFTHHPIGAGLFIDDFSIVHQPVSKNALQEKLLFELPIDKGNYGFAFNSGGNSYSIITPESSKGNLQSLRIDYSVSEDDGYAGWYYDLRGMDISSRNAIRIKASGVRQDALWGMMSTNRVERKVRMQDFLKESEAGGKQVFEIPLVYFGAVSLQSISRISITLCSEGSIRLSQITFENIGFSDLPIMNFKSAQSLFGWQVNLFQNGKAHIDRTSTANELLLDFNVDTGMNAIDEALSYCGFEIPLGGVDVSAYDQLSISIKGHGKNSYVNIYLDDGNKRWPFELNIKNTAETEYITYSIPLSHFRHNKIDLSYLARVQLVFEWRPDKGKLGINDIRFTKGQKDPKI